MINITNEDNMQLMARYPDNYFDLAIVDPPYGIKENSNRKNKPKKAAAAKKEYHTSLWDQDKPNKDYYTELFRVSKNQIIWGGNYFTDNLPESRCWIIWDKQSQFARQVADVEMAWTSFERSAKLFSFQWCGMLQGDMKNKQDRIHPTQKPIQLYTFILQNFIEPNSKILDTHIGSGSIALAVDNANKIDKMNLTLVGCELDKDYYNATMKRIKEQTSWQSLF
jgi:site-specific DNA-methyltransferase (adenine-specific)